MLDKDDLLFSSASGVYPPQVVASVDKVSAASSKKCFVETLTPNDVRSFTQLVESLKGRAPTVCENDEEVIYYELSGTSSDTKTGKGKGQFMMRPIRVQDPNYPALSSFLGTHISHRPHSLNQVVQRNFLNPAGTDVGIVVAVQVYTEKSEGKKAGSESEEGKKAGSESESETEEEF